VTNCIFWGDEPNEIIDNIGGISTVNYCAVQGGWGDPNDPNNTNIDTDPLFVDANNPDPNLWNFRLTSASPCIDAADSAALLAIPVYYDMDGKDRYVDIDSIDDVGTGPWEFLDMGAYEFQHSIVPGDNDCDGAVGFRDLAILCNNWLAGKKQ
jgi:hypothetical protein